MLETKRFFSLLITILILNIGSTLFAQQTQTHTTPLSVADTLTPQITWTNRDSLIEFLSNLRPLRQIAGAPQAFYTYFWEFGDGAFSFDDQPTHSYKDTGAYNVQLFATNNYDDGKPPPTHPRRIQVTNANPNAASIPPGGFFTKGNPLQLKVNRMPRPGEDMVCIIGYQNPEGPEAISGSLVLFYNEKAFKKKNFGLTDLKSYHQEQSSNMGALLATSQTPNIVPLYATNQVPSFGPSHFIASEIVSNSSALSLLQSKRMQYETDNTLHFDGLKTKEQRFVFVILHTTPDMIKDTNATVTLSAVLIPDDPTKPIVENNLALQIVASHDPNRMMLRNRRLNYRFMGQHKALNYKVRFQNTGKGPAKRIDIGIKIPHELEVSTLSLKDQYPACIPCAAAEPGQSCLDTLTTQDSIHFIFKNIYLPGVRQKGVEDKDSTQGFVEYRLRFKEKPPKIPFWSQAAIVFDKNEPVFTNKMHTRFMHGISPAIIAGYLKGLEGNQGPNSPFIIGAALAPYSPYRFYLQVEAYMGIYKKSTTTTINPLPEPRDTAIQRIGYMITDRGATTQTSLLSLDIVPIEVRKNMNDWFSIGSGLWLKGNLREKVMVTPLTRLKSIKEGTTLELPGEQITENRTFSSVNPAFFVDLNIGRVRVGPALGARLLHFFAPNKTGLMLYASWRL